MWILWLFSDRLSFFNGEGLISTMRDEAGNSFISCTYLYASIIQKIRTGRTLCINYRVLAVFLKAEEISLGHRSKACQSYKWYLLQRFSFADIWKMSESTSQNISVNLLRLVHIRWHLRTQCLLIWGTMYVLHFSQKRG